MGDVLVFPHWRIDEVTVERDEPAQVYILPFAPRELQAREHVCNGIDIFGDTDLFGNLNCRCFPLGELDEIIDALNAITE